MEKMNVLYLSNLFTSFWIVRQYLSNVKCVKYTYLRIMSNLNYSNEEYLNLICLYGQCNKNISRTCDLFAEKYPNVATPNRRFVRQVVENLISFGSFKSTTTKIRPVLNDEDTAITVLGYFTAYPNASLRDAQRDLGIPFKSIHRILRKYKFKPYSYSLVHNLWLDDPCRRIRFCEFFLTKIQEDEQFLRKIIWSDEAKFSRNGLFNRKNSHYWADRNPHVRRETHYQVSWSFNVYCAIKDDKVLNVHIYDDNLNGAEYVNIIRNYLGESLENLPLNEYVTAWYQHDGAPIHNTREVGEVLNIIFEDRWIATNGPFEWPPRSPDLTPLDFYVWGRIKSMVFATAATTKEDMKQRVRAAFRDLDAAEIRRATQSLSTRVQKCLAANGHQFEHLN